MNTHHLKILLPLTLLIGVFAVPATATAAVYGANGGGNNLSTTGGGGGGGGGGRVMINDLTFSGIDAPWQEAQGNRKIRFNRTGDKGHNAFFQKNNRNVAYNGGKTAVAEPPGYGANFVRTPSALNKYYFDQVRYTNTCFVRKDVLYSNDGNCMHFLTFGSVFGWHQVHGAGPSSAESVGNFDTSTGTQGNGNVAMVRIWRECRGELSGNPAAAAKVQIQKYVAEGQGEAQPTTSVSQDHCDTTPIFERTVAPDKRTSQENYFYGYWDQGTKKYRPGSESRAALSSVSVKDRVSGGGLNKSCSRTTIQSAKKRKFCTVGGHYNPNASGPYLQRRCQNGGLGDNVVWTRNELRGEIAYRQNHGTQKGFFRRHKNQLNSWANSGNGPYPATPFPAFANTFRERNQLCETLNEWVAVKWRVPGPAGGVRSRVNLRFNGIPGRIYTSQIVILDPRENILHQSVNTFTAPSLPGPEGGPVCIPPDPRCPQPPPEPAADTSPPIGGIPAGECDKSSLSNTPSSCEVSATPEAPAEEGIDGETGESSGDTDYSRWFPRALQVGIYNREDATSSNVFAAYNRNHPQRTIYGGGGAWRQESAQDGELRGRAGHGSDPQIITAKAPLFSDGDRSLAGGFDTTVRRATETPSYDPNNPDHNLAEQFRTNDVRYNGLVGENRRPVGSWNPNAPISYSPFTRLTSEFCEAGSPGVARFSDGPEVSRSCNAFEPLGFGWTAKDAYYLPPVTAGGARELNGAQYTDLSTNFTQEKDGPARLKLDAHGPNNNIRNRLVRIEIWDADVYPGNPQDIYDEAGEDDGGAAPVYTVKPERAAYANGEIRFCRTTKTETRSYTRPRYLYTVSHLDQYRFDRSLDGGRGGYGNEAVSNENDASFYNEGRFYGNGGAAPDEPYWKRDDGRLYKRDARPGGAGNYTQIWGRWWWPHHTQGAGGSWNYRAPGGPPATDIGGPYNVYSRTPETVFYDVVVPDPACVSENSPVDAQAWSVEEQQYVETLPKGRYVVRYVVSFDAAYGDFPGGHWGIRSRLMENPTQNWVNKFTFQLSRNFLPVFDSRASG